MDTEYDKLINYLNKTVKNIDYKYKLFNYTYTNCNSFLEEVYEDYCKEDVWSLVEYLYEHEEE